MEQSFEVPTFPVVYKKKLPKFFFNLLRMKVDTKLILVALLRLTLNMLL
jgi:hypothetical protein